MVFKEYPGVDPISLPRDIRHTQESLSQVLKHPSAGKHDTLHVEDLSRILLLSYSLTGRTHQADGDFYYRSAASAGALYPTELYVAAMGVAGLEPGLYHFSIAHHGLSLLRKGDLTGPVTHSTFYTGKRAPVVTFFLSAIYFRSSWKYRERSYRYHLMDTGHVAENLMLALRSAGAKAILSYDFDDRRLNHLLGLDQRREACLAVCHVHGNRGPAEAAALDLAELPRLYQAASQVALREIDYPALHEIHAAGSHPPRAQGKGGMISQLGITPSDWTPLPSLDSWPETTPYPDAVFTRRSRRNFVSRLLPNSQFLSLLDGLCQNLSELDHTRICTGFLAGNVEGLDPGIYLLDKANRSMGKTAEGSFVDRMTRVCLGQEWLANAALHFLFMANLESLENAWGTRGYRHAMLTAGRSGERLYLMATALGLGCCGIGAFYDGEAMELIGLNDSSRLLYLVAVGPIKRA